MKRVVVVVAAGLLAVSAAASKDAFVFHETNEYNYTYGSDSNWTFVPCKKGFSGGVTCSRLTGNWKTKCRRSESTPFYGICTCYHVYGLSAESRSDCKNFNETSPRCLSGPSGCSAQMPEAYFSATGDAAICICSLIFLFKSLALGWHKFTYASFALNASICTLFFVILGFVSVFILSFGNLQVPMRWSEEIYVTMDMLGAGMLAIALPGTLFMLQFCFNRVIITVKTMSKAAAERALKRQLLVIGVPGIFLFVAMVIAQVLRLSSVASGISTLICMFFGIFFLTSGKRFESTLKNHDAALSMVETSRCTTRTVGAILLSFVPASATVAVLSRTIIEKRTRTVTVLHTVFYLTMKILILAAGCAVYAFLASSSVSKHVGGSSKKGSKIVPVPTLNNDQRSDITSTIIE